MINEFQEIQTVQFQEHPVIDISQTEPHVYDISAAGLETPSSFLEKGAFLIDIYCQSLIHKIQILAKNDIAEFIDYQCSLVKNPLIWLDHLESLLELNYSLFESICNKSRMHKLYVIVQLKRNELKPRRKPLKSQLYDLEEVASNEMVKFDFRTVKFDLNNLTTYEDRKAYLIELKAEFLESDQYILMNNGKSLDNLIDIEMEKLDRLESIKPTSQSMIKPTKPANNNQLRINGKVNVLVDAFYQMLYEIRSDNKPYLNYSPTEVAQFITNHFLDKDGFEIPISTIRTILSPGKSDKRPSTDKKLKLNNGLM